jgi:predicted AAA+ superfamily ATPase
MYLLSSLGLLITNRIKIVSLNKNAVTAKMFIRGSGMKTIKRDRYLGELKARRGNGLIKVITGIRRCGKSYLLDPIYKDWLLSQGVPKDHIIKIELDRPESRKYHHDAEAFDRYLLSLLKDKGMYYALLDEIHLVDGFEFVLNGLLYRSNVDVDVTGSNSRFLSSDVITEFRGRGDLVAMGPLSFSEYCSAVASDKRVPFRETFRQCDGSSPGTEKPENEYLPGYALSMAEMSPWNDRAGMATSMSSSQGMKPWCRTTPRNVPPTRM